MFDSYSGHQLLNDLRQFCDGLFLIEDLRSERKSDNTLVTKVDREISDFFKRHPATQAFTFYSEEDFSSLVFPALILDPIDGTRELVAGRAECAVSACYMPTPHLKDAACLIFNPFTGFGMSSDDAPVWTSAPVTHRPLGMVSRSEWESGLYSEAGAFDLVPRGSIAYKLALLAAGSIDFVVTKKPKNIWDIAAGTHLCWQRGIQLWSQGEVVTRFDKAAIEGPLLWCRPELATSLRGSFSI